MFDYVMVLVSVVIGLALTHLMQGVAGLIQQPGKTRIWWVHLVWVAFVMITAAFFWWWEYALHDLTRWTFQTYLLLLLYAFVIYLSAAVLFPHELEPGVSLEAYFIGRRRWFFGLQMLWQTLDGVDSLSKGMAHAQSLGIEYWVSEAVFIALCAVGMKTARPRIHAGIALIFFLYTFTFAFRTFDTIQ